MCSTLWVYVSSITLLFTNVALENSATITIGIISNADEDPRQVNAQFLSYSNVSRIRLTPHLENVHKNPTYLKLTQASCSMLKAGVNVLVSEFHPHLLAYSHRYQLPFLSLNDPSNRHSEVNLISLLPNPSKAIADLMAYYGWESFVYFYENDDGPALLLDILEATSHKINVNVIWKVTHWEAVQHYLQLKSDQKDRKIVMATSGNLLTDFITGISKSGSSDTYHIILANSEVRPERLEGSLKQFKITQLSLIDRHKEGYRNLVNRWNTLISKSRLSATQEVPNSAIVIRDAATVVQNSVSRLVDQESSASLKQKTRDCMKDDETGANNIQYLLNSIKHTDISALTGRIKFSASGQREGYNFAVQELTPGSTKTTGSWSLETGLRVFFEPDEEQRDLPHPEKLRQTKTKMKVVSIVAPPYLIDRTVAEKGLNESSFSGNERFKGFVKDMLDSLRDSMQWDYELVLVKDGYYGLKTPGGQWSGMIGEVSRGEVDVAVAPITMSSERAEVVDFSLPFMRVGLNIVMKKPMDPELDKMGPLVFLNVWSYEIWLLLILSFTTFGFISYGFSHYLGEPDRVRSLDTKISDRLSLCSSFWFALGGLTQRSTGIYPRTIANRVLTMVWGIFSLVVFVMYTASITFAILRSRTTSETTLYSKSSIDVLQNFLDEGYPNIGIIPNGSTAAFFKKAERGIFKEFGNYLDGHPEEQPRNSSEGVKRMRADEDFAMILESSTSEYVVNNKPCDLTVTAGYLNNIAYGVVLPKGSKLMDEVNEAILTLTEEGTLRKLYEKWWHHESTCEDPSLNVLSSIYSNALTLGEVSGVFYFLIMTVGLATILAGTEYYNRHKRLSG